MTDDKGTKLILLRIAAELAAARAQRHLLACSALIVLAVSFHNAAFFAIIACIPFAALAYYAMRDAWAISQEAKAAK